MLQDLDLTSKALVVKVIPALAAAVRSAAREIVGDDLIVQDEIAQTILFKLTGFLMQGLIRNEDFADILIVHPLQLTSTHAEHWLSDRQVRSFYADLDVDDDEPDAEPPTPEKSQETSTPPADDFTHTLGTLYEQELKDRAAADQEARNDADLRILMVKFVEDFGSLLRDRAGDLAMRKFGVRNEAFNTDTSAGLMLWQLLEFLTQAHFEPGDRAGLVQHFQLTRHHAENYFRITTGVRRNPDTGEAEGYPVPSSLDESEAE